MYIAPGQGQTTPWGQMLMSTEKYDFKHILNDFIHEYSPRAGTDNPLRTKFWCQQKFLITLPICWQFKKNLEVWFFTVFYAFFSHVYSPRQGQTTHWGQKFYDNRKAFSLCPYVASFKMIWGARWLSGRVSDSGATGPGFETYLHRVVSLSKTLYSPKVLVNYPGSEKLLTGTLSLNTTNQPTKMISSKSDFIHIFNDFIHVYCPGARAENPLGTNFWCQQKALATSTICCKFQTNLFEFWFYAHFLMFFHMYIAPGQGQTTLCGQNYDVNRKALSLCPFVASFKKNIFEVWF